MAEPYSFVSREEEEEEEEEKEEGEEKNKKRLPNPVGIPKRGPLKLNSSAKTQDGLSTEADRSTQTPSWRKRRRTFTYPPSEHQPRRSLTRFPVPMLQRPMENLERELGQLSCAELLEGVTSLRVSIDNEKVGYFPQVHLAGISVV